MERTQVRRSKVAMLGLAAAGLLVACAPASDQDGGTATPSPTSSTPGATSTPISPTDLPTTQAPTAPPTTPTDALPTDLVAGRVSALADGCLEVTTEDGEVWSLTTAVDVDLVVGDVVRAKVEPLGEADAPCGDGIAAAATSVELVD